MTDISTPTLTSAQRKQLRGLAHDLKPLVHVGQHGLSEGVVAAIDRALLDHELIKVRLHEPEAKHEAAEELATRCQATLCGLIGHTVILYRAHPEQPRIQV